MGPIARVERLFATPILVQDYEDDPLIKPLEEAILTRRREHPGIRRSNVGGWHSETDFGQWAGDAGRALFQRAADLAAAHTIDIKTGQSPQRWFTVAWANVNKSGDTNQIHSHGGAYWSAVYYVRLNEGDGGALLLQDPRSPAIAMHAPTYRFRDLGPEEVASVRPRAGTLVMFPSWLLHSVESWQGKGLRISVALNLSAIP